MAKSEREIAVEVICGKWGNGDERVVNLVPEMFDKVTGLMNKTKKDVVIPDAPIQEV